MFSTSAPVIPGSKAQRKLIFEGRLTNDLVNKGTNLLLDSVVIPGHIVGWSLRVTEDMVWPEVF